MGYQHKCQKWISRTLNNFKLNTYIWDIIQGKKKFFLNWLRKMILSKTFGGAKSWHER